MAEFSPRKILVAFDLSRRSRAGWRYAQELASRLRAELEAIYVAPWIPVAVAPGLGPVAPPPSTLISERRESILRLIKDRLGPGAPVRIAEGEPARRILEAAAESGADLIVMTTRGLTGVRRAVGGSTTEAVVRSSPVPVLSLRGEARLPGSILAPVNAEPYALEGLGFARSAARAFGAGVTALHVVEARREPNAPLRVRRLEEAVRPMEEVEFRITDGEPVWRILEEAAGHDLVVLVSRRKGRLRDAILGTTAEQVLRRSPVPVLCVPARPAGPPFRRQERRARRERGLPARAEGRLARRRT